MHPRPSTHDVIIGHSLGAPHDPLPEHVTSHAHDIEHFTFLWHDRSPLQTTSHRPTGHWITSPHEDGPVHCTSHELAVWHCTWCAHAWSPHRTRHGRFVGHTTSLALQLPAALQSTTHTPSWSHVPPVQPCSHSASA